MVDYHLIAVLMTCHNRKESTLRSLSALFACRVPPQVTVKVFVTDDGSSDGTAEAIAAQFPAITVIRGSGELFWNGGMRLAFDEAIRHSCNFYLWLNDDTYLNPNALSVLVETQRTMARELGQEGIAVGTTCDPVTGEVTYGGLVSKNALHPLGFNRVCPRKSLTPVDTMEGNCVLIARSVVDAIGGLDDRFVHSMGDIDFGLRAKAAGFPLRVSPEIVGTCSRNSEAGTYRDLSLSLSVRLRAMMHPKGLPPEEWVILVRRHAGFLWPVYAVLPYLKVVAGASWRRVSCR